MSKKMDNRKKMIAYIKKNIPFYEFTDITGHSDNQLLKIIKLHKKKKQ